MNPECAIAMEPAGAATGTLMDDEAFAGFYQRTARPLWAYLVRVLGDPALADDLVQESYVRFIGAVRWSQGEAACRSFLFRIATNLMRDHWRQPATTPIDEVPESALPLCNCQSDEQIDSQTLLEPVFASMKPKERQLLWLAYAEGATHREIAQITGLASASIRLLLFRARRKMARLLRQQMRVRRNP